MNWPDYGGLTSSNYKGGEKTVVKISDLDEYLHADAIKEGDAIEIAGKARYVSSEEAAFGRPYLEMPVKLMNGKSRIWTPNKTTLKRLAKAYGDDTDSWVGKRVKLTITKQNVRGEMRNVIYGQPQIEPVQTQSQQPTQEPLFQ